MKRSVLLALLCLPAAHAALIYENIGGTPLIYDTLTKATWTQDANLSGQTFTFAQAQSWAAGLSMVGLPWQLPTAEQFTSLYTDLDPYGAPGVAGPKYGAIVDFGNGPNDYAANVQTQYWTRTSGEDFNFFYGYPGGFPDSTTFAAWAVEAPEPSPALLMLCALVLVLAPRIKRVLA